MATRKYKPYPTRKQQKNRMMRNVALTLIVLIVAILIFNRMYKDKSPSPEQDNNPTVAVSDIMPSTEPETRQSTLTVLNPAVASANEQPAPTPRPTPAPQPEAISQPVSETPSVTAPPEPEVQPVMAEPPAVADAQGDESSSQAKELVEESLKLRDAGKIIQARELLNDTLNEKLSSNLRSSVKFQLNKLAEKWLFSSDVFPGDKLTAYYQVQRATIWNGLPKSTRCRMRF